MTCRCGASAGEVEIVRDGETVGFGYLCDRCMDEALEGAAAWRAQFDELIVAGCPRDRANAILISRMDGEASS